MFIREDGSPYIIAEIGKNFIETENSRSVAEYLSNAIKLVDAAKECGVDAVKFQTHEYTDEQIDIPIVSPHFKGSDRYSWVKRNTDSTPVETFWRPLSQHCRNEGITFFSTPMSRAAAIKLQGLDVSLWKVGSGDVQDYITLNYLLRSKKPIIISTGMVSFAELADVVAHIENTGVPFAILYCVSQYPAPAESFNLASIERFQRLFPRATIGFSDHSIGSDAALAAVKLGARIIEKHFSFSRDLWGADHKVSMTPSEMKTLVESVRSRAYESVDPAKFYGSYDRELEGANNQFRPYFNKSLVAARDIAAGEVITEEMIYAMRPKMYIDGLASDKVGIVVGRMATKALRRFSALRLEDLNDDDRSR